MKLTFGHDLRLKVGGDFEDGVKGTFQKLLSGFCPLRGGVYPPFPLRVFGQDDCP